MSETEVRRDISCPAKARELTAFLEAFVSSVEVPSVEP